jgi:hypothetical protein
LSESLSKMKVTPILMLFDLRIQLPLDGLAKRKALKFLSPKTVTRKVRKNLRKILDEERIKVACWALLKNGIWVGHGTYNGERFNWVVINGFSQIDILY